MRKPPPFQAPVAAASSIALALVMFLLPISTAPAQSGAECLGFVEQTVTDAGTNGVESIQVADLDGDGYPDIVSSSFGDDKLFWYENDETKGIDDPQRFSPNLISDRIRGAAGVYVEDLDGDGFPDILAAARTSDSVFWFEQARGSPVLFTARTIAVNAQLVLGVYAADVNGDLRIDVLTASFLDDTIAWYENIPPPEGTIEPPTFRKHIVTDDAIGAASVFAVDLNGDGLVDVLSASRLDDTVAWYEQRPPDPDAVIPVPRWIKHVIDGDVAGATSVTAFDIDRDGDIDVLAAAQAGNAIYWWPNDAGDFASAVRQTLPGSLAGPRVVRVADVNGDDAPDVLSASYRDDKIAWYESDCTSLPCGIPSFTQHLVSTSSTHANDVAAGDLDQDGLVDLVSASSLPGFPASQDKLAWYRNVAAAAPGLPTERRIYRSADGAVAAFAGDLDGDGDVDLATAGRANRIAWHENDGAVKPAFAENVVSTDAVGAIDVLGADLDCDGDVDLVSASTDDDKIAWYENDGAADPTFPERVVSTDARGAQDVFVIDLDGDMLPDILSASSVDGKIAWYENQCADGSCGPPSSCEPTLVEHVITANDLSAMPPVVTGAPRSVHAADMDGDGDLDVLGAFFEANRVRWYENDLANPQLEQWVEHDVLETGGSQFLLFGATSVFGADLDADSDTDLIITAATGRLVAWLESDGANPPAFAAQVLASDANDASQAYAVDLDGDLDLDVLAAIPGDAVIVFFESDFTQTKGAQTPTFAINIVAQSMDFALATTVGNVDGDTMKDGTPVNDVVTGQRLAVSWFQASDEICQDFDVNGDGQLDGLELVWIGRAFGLSSPTPQAEWWGAADLTGDGTIDGDDLAYLATPGVFGFSTTDCSFVCR